MEIYLLRHGIAVPRGSKGYLGDADDKRPLTPLGISRMKQGAKGMSRLGIKVDAVLSSPLPRAIETARIVAEILKCPRCLNEIQELAPGTPLPVWDALLQKYKKDSRVLLVGHEPDLSQWAVYALAGVNKGYADYIELKKGGLARLDIEFVQGRPRGTLCWLLPPKVLRALGC